MEQQFLHNRNKSLFYTLADGRLVLSPSEESTELVKHKAREIGKFIQSAKVNGTYIELLKDISEKNIKLFMEVNQYLDFNHEDHRKLQKIYGDLFERVYIMGNRGEISDRDIDHLFRSHYKNLQTFLLDSNGTEIFKKYRENPDLFAVKCAEYSPEFQMKLLNIDVAPIKQPVLDIGCGPQASLVHFLRENGIEAYGVDRNVDTMDYLYKMSWLEYSFTSNKWGTVISHMAFSNHFMHHHIRADGNFEIYAMKYMEIVKSLKVGGSFIYAPSLTFMEEALMSASNSYDVEIREHSTKVTRLK
ncbi:class I SAM-dependent methyltransferase [Bacillus sp. V59.32b]|nr:class I SAM-dependent methyltransferase [Bacillus sp. V59.32b]